MALVEKDASFSASSQLPRQRKIQLYWTPEKRKEISEDQTGKTRGEYKKSKTSLKAKAEREASLKAAQARKTKENDAIKLEDMRDPTARRKLALKVFAYEGLAGGSAMEAAALGRMSAKEVLAAPLERTNGELVDEKKWVEYTAMDRTALITKGYRMMIALREKARKA
jgi:hypothetical protein